MCSDEGMPEGSRGVNPDGWHLAEDRSRQRTGEWEH